MIGSPNLLRTEDTITERQHALPWHADVPDLDEAFVLAGAKLAAPRLRAEIVALGEPLLAMLAVLCVVVLAVEAAVS